MIVNHQVAYARRSAKCRCGCEKKLRVGDRMIRTLFYNPKTRQTHVKCFFFQHWVDAEKLWFKENPFVLKTQGGRKPLMITDEMKIRRAYLLRRYARCKLALRTIYKFNSEITPKLQSQIDRHQESINQLRVEMEVCGGVPKSWQ